MVLPKTLRVREQLEDLRESPASLWGDKLKRMAEISSSQDVTVAFGYYGSVTFSPFGNILLRDALRIEAVNEYFRIKAGKVFGNTKALEILSELRSKQVIPRDEWGQFDINQNAVALAMLSAAGLCQVDDYSISITNEGKQFIDDILE